MEQTLQKQNTLINIALDAIDYLPTIYLVVS